MKILKLFNWIDSYYVDSVNLGKISEEVMKSTLQKMDPHSAYISKEEVDQMNEPLQGNFEGIGITFNILNDTIFIVSPVVGGPSEKVGIRAGDRIIFINDEKVTGKEVNNKKVFSKLRGKKGSVVKVDIKRHGEPQLLTFSIVRDKIPIHSVDASYKINSNTGYIRLSRFSSTSKSEIETILVKFQEEKVKNIILDLSGNGGGYLDVAVELADEFLDEKKLIVYTQGIHSEKKEYVSTSTGHFEKGKLVIMIDEGSASASEILAGAIQDWDRGIIVGRRSFGKGLVQRPFTFSDGSMVRLTVARYYTPSGRLIQKNYADGYESYSNELFSRVRNGELLDKEKFIMPDSLKYYTLIHKRTVYGGGGIMPDEFVPLDTSAYSNFFRSLISKSILNSFALEYTDKNREELSKTYPDFEKFKANFVANDNILDELVKYASKLSIASTPQELAQSKPQITLLLKAYIARDIWGLNAFFEIYNTTNPSYNQAINALNNWGKYFDKK